MRGKVLEVGLISGDDGNRYSFEPSDVSNLGRRTLDSLKGCEVDFQVNEGKASSIFIIKGGDIIDNIAYHSGINALGLTLFVGPIGAFFSWWLIAKWNVLKSALYTLGYFVAFVISGFLCYFVIGFILIPTVYIVMCIHVYKSAKSQ